MDLAVNALFHMGRSRDLRTWFLIDEVHALHRLPAIDHGLQTARAFGGAFVLGMHSFDKLEETYGENGATNLASLAGTKLILKTADPETSRRCSEFIGNRQVRIMDEAYSYGYNDNRDASTITPRTNVEELVMPVDISDLPSMHGFVKFPDGFPAARIMLTWKDYEPRAKGFERVTDMRAAEYTPPSGDGAELGGGDREGAQPDIAPKERKDREEVALSEAERAAQQLREAIEGPLNPERELTEEEVARKIEDEEERADFERKPAQGELYGYNRPGKKDQRERQNLAMRDSEERGAQAKIEGPKGRAQNSRADAQESELSKENMRGIGNERQSRQDPSIDDDQELGR